MWFVREAWFVSLWFRSVHLAQRGSPESIALIGIKEEIWASIIPGNCPVLGF
jgi:hypothetical protein